MRLKSFVSIKDNRVFASAYKNSKCLRQEHLLLFFSDFGGREVGFTVSKKVGNAVVRNKTKRRIKSLFFEIGDKLRDGRYIFVAKPSIANADFLQIRDNFNKLTTKYI